MNYDHIIESISYLNITYNNTWYLWIYEPITISVNRIIINIVMDYKLRIKVRNNYSEGEFTLDFVIPLRISRMK